MDLLGDAHDYFDDRSDIEDGDYGVPRPNTEMWLMNRCERVMDSLPAILAALTEADALRAQVAASQAREVALREAGEGLLRLVNDPYDKNTWSANSEKAWNALRAALSTPTDTAALRAFGERCVLAGWVGGNNYAFPDEPEELVVADIPPDAQQQIAAIVDRVLGGS